MKKAKAIVIILFLSAFMLMPPLTSAAATPYFMALNNTLMPLNSDTMPHVIDGEIFVSHEFFGLLHSADYDIGRARLIRGERRIDFYSIQGITVDQHGNFLNWPQPTRVGSHFYVPLRQVSNYFGLTYEILDVGSDIISDQQMQIIRIITDTMFAHSSRRFLENNRDSLRDAYSAFFDRFPGDTPPTGPGVAGQPNFSDVTLYISFKNLNGDSLPMVLDTFDSPEADGYRAAFFISADEAARHSDLIRRITGSGHTVGVWLEEGTAEEFLEASSLIFEASKIKTLFISADEAAEVSMETALTHGLIFWNASQQFEVSMYDTGGALTDIFPTVGGERQNIMFSCSEETALLLPGIISFLRSNEYSVAKITETVKPILQR